MSGEDCTLKLYYTEALVEIQGPEMLGLRIDVLVDVWITAKVPRGNETNTDLDSEKA